MNRLLIVPGTLCKLEGCNEPCNARGLCKKDYATWRKHKNSGSCSEKNCDLPFYSKSFCVRHYDQNYRLGHTRETTYYDPRPAVRLGGIARIPLGVGGNQGFVMVDGHNAWLDCLNWGLNGRGYATAAIDGKLMTMHRLIAKCVGSQWADHRDAHRLNNLENNLRICNPGQNARNRGKQGAPATSKYKGVSQRKIDGKFRVRITFDDRVIHLGYFDREVDAAVAYDRAAIELHGEFARTNFGDSRCA